MKISFSDRKLPVAVVVIGLLAGIVLFDLQHKSYEVPVDAMPPEPETGLTRLVAFRDAARAADLVFEPPDWPRTPDRVEARMDAAIDASRHLLDEIAEVEPWQASFRNTVQALEMAMYPALDAYGVIAVISETHPDAAMRAAAREAGKRFSAWAVRAGFREDVYRVIAAYADTDPPLGGADRKLFEDTLRDYRRRGMELPRDERDELQRLLTRLRELEIDFDRNINEADCYLEFREEELAGVPADFLADESLRTPDGHVRINANVSWQVVVLLQHAADAEVRRRVAAARFRRAVDGNLPLLKEMLELRARIADMLGYDSWADYRAETRMAGDAATAMAFQQQLKTRLDGKFREELEVLRELKREETGDDEARIDYWDVPYYTNLLKKRRYGIDSEELKVFFELEQTLAGMFGVFEELFAVEITQVEAPYRWHDDVRLYAVTDTGSGSPLGLLYLDLHPRQGKYKHFAHFGITPARRLADGRMQRPVGALVGNFPPSSPGRPSLLSLDDVGTLFHEFGHAMHHILSTAVYASQSGTSVPTDFVEAPSQMLEYWARDKAVLDRFAADYRDPGRKIPAATLDALEQARLAGIATFERGQLAYSLIDMRLHRLRKPAQCNRLVSLANAIAADVYLPYPEDTAMIASFGHLVDYDAGYYGYAWSRAIAEDMITVFRDSAGALMDREVGIRLRNQIYEVGSSRDVEASIEAFLGRERSLQPYFESLGGI